MYAADVRGCRGCKEMPGFKGAVGASVRSRTSGGVRGCKGMYKGVGESVHIGHKGLYGDVRGCGASVCNGPKGL